MRFLFVKNDLCWPRASGHDVHSYHMMKALIASGHDVALTTLVELKQEAVEGLQLCDLSVMPSTQPKNGKSIPAEEQQSGDEFNGLSWRQERFRSYWGIDKNDIRFVQSKADCLDVDAVVVVGIEVLPYLAAVKGRQRIWYAADEWVWHYLSLIKATRPKSWSNLRSAVIMGLYENSFASVIDRAWVVSRADQRALQMVASIPSVDVVPNGVDAKMFEPSLVQGHPYSCTFWGCLDFAPNVQALQWFCEKVWPRVMRAEPQARFHIYGFNPAPEVLKLADGDGISLVPNVPCIRSAVERHQVVVLPFKSGGGVKNKLLEAASMAKPIVCSQRSCNGLNATANVPFRVVSGRASDWANALISLWNDASARDAIGQAAFEWVTENHSWNASAEKAALPLQKFDGGENGRKYSTTNKQTELETA